MTRIASSLRDAGTFMMVDLAASARFESDLHHALGPTLCAFSVFHCLTVSLAHGSARPETMWGDDLARNMLAEAGFQAVDVRHIDGDMLAANYVCGGCDH
jgi:hypothetical protein